LDDKLLLDFKRGIADLEKKKLTVYVQAKGMAWFEVEADKIRQVILGLKTEDMKRALSKKLGIQAAEIKLQPVWANHAPRDAQG